MLAGGRCLCSAGPWGLRSAQFWRDATASVPDCRPTLSLRWLMLPGLSQRSLRRGGIPGCRSTEVYLLSALCLKSRRILKVSLRLNHVCLGHSGANDKPEHFLTFLCCLGESWSWHHTTPSNKFQSDSVLCKVKPSLSSEEMYYNHQIFILDSILQRKHHFEEFEYKIHHHAETRGWIAKASLLMSQASTVPPSVAN